MQLEKEKFFDSLQQALDEIPSTDCYILLGDFIARVGSGESAAAEWEHVRGPQGHGEVNEAGKELLTSLSLSKATVYNTWFIKKDTHEQTWQHPRSKKWHCIDCTITRQADCKRCLNAAVIRC